MYRGLFSVASVQSSEVLQVNVAPGTHHVTVAGSGRGTSPQTSHVIHLEAGQSVDITLSV